MQVTKVEDTASHAIISANTSSSFSVSNNAEFFHILSDTLYSDKPLAVVREVLCNAWDAHIDSGRQDTPVIVTIKDGQMIIKDVGHGIPQDKITDIYCKYGESTKRNDGKQTGGFGLGSKAPFAICDTFEVVSCHAGTKTIYRVSKSMVEQEGRPGIIAVVSVPTEETGMTITIPLPIEDSTNSWAQQSIYNNFTSLVRKIAKNGEMNVILNDVVCEKANFSEGPNGWMFTSDVDVSNNTGIAVRYGNVLYPVPQHEKYADWFKAINDLRTKLPTQSNQRMTLVFMAPPHSISVTPSRESLSMNEHTINTLEGLMRDFSMSFNTILESECRIEAVRLFEESAQKKEFTPFFKPAPGMPGCRENYVYRNYMKDNQSPELMDKLATAQEIVRYFIRFNYPSFAGFKKFEALTRISLLLKHKEGNPSHLKSLQRLIQQGSVRGAKIDVKSFFMKNIVWPIRRQALLEGIKDLNLNFLPAERWEYDTTSHRPIPINKIKFADNFWTMFPYMKRYVILSHRITDVNERASKHELLKGIGTGNMLVVIVPKTPEKKDAVFKLFRDLKYNIVDLTVRQSWETETVKVADVDAPKKPKTLKGLVPLSQLVSRKNGRVTTNEFAWSDQSRKIIKPSVVIRFSRHGVDGYSHDDLRRINHLFGDKIGCAVSNPQLAKYIKEGAIEFEDFFIDSFLTKLQNEIAFVMRIAWDQQIIKRGLDELDLGFPLHWAHLITTDPSIRAALRIRDILTEEDQMWLDQWRSMMSKYHWKPFNKKDPRVIKVNRILNTIPLDYRIERVAKRIKTTRIFRYMDSHTLAYDITDYSTSYPDKLFARKVLINILKGNTANG